MKFKLTYVILMCIFFFNTRLFGQFKEIQTSVNNNSFLIGQIIEIYFEIPSDKGINFPPLEDEIYGFTILSYWDTVSISEESVFLSLKITRFDTGYFEFKPVKFITESDTLISKSITIYVGLPELKDDTEIYDIKPNVSFYNDSWILYGILILILSLISYFLIKRFTKIKLKKNNLNNHEILIPEDQIIEKIKLYQKMYFNNEMTPREFYFKIDEILREYLEYKYSYKFLESTNSEVRNLLLKIPLSIHYIEFLNQFFNKAELIKFAKGSDDKESSKKLIDEMIKFLNSQKVNPFNENEVSDRENLLK